MSEMSTHHEVTERRNVEKELRARIAELEHLTRTGPVTKPRRPADDDR